MGKKAKNQKQNKKKKYSGQQQKEMDCDWTPFGAE
jgi:hypothetical protein